ncbi:MAG: hypothetical protein KIS61_31125 [Candidatus Eremiobacteraeota bacterium]|nr:hypothetical protein [Candidatus Eremiobacteraeota bacterium]
MGPLLAPLGFAGGGGRLRKDEWVLEILPGPDRFEVGVGKGGKTWADCPQRTTLGELWKGKPYYWKVVSPGDIKRAVEQVTVLVLELALPWFRKD